MDYKLSYLLKSNDTSQVNLDEAMEVTNLSREDLLSGLRQFNYKINKNEIRIQKVSPLKWTEYYFQSENNIHELGIEERQYMIFLIIYSEEYESSVYHFQDILDVSRGTIMSDMKALRNNLHKDGIKISYDRCKGYFLEGNNHNMIRNARNYISKLLETDSGKFILHYFVSHKNLGTYASVKDTILHHINKSDYNLVPSRIDEVIFFSIFSKNQFLQGNPEYLNELDEVKSTKIYSSIKVMLVDLYGKEISSIYTCIYTVNILTILQGNIHDPAFDFLLQISAEIIHSVEKYAAIQFSNFRELLFNVYNHLVPAYFRIKYNLYLSNVLMDTIYNEYLSVFNVTQKGIKPLEIITGSIIPDEEVGYFTILFGGAINADSNAKIEDKRFKALIVCPNGISSSMILESELRLLFPTLDFSASNSIEGLESTPKDSYDFIFSTVPIDTHKKVYVVKPIMNQLEKNKLINIVQSEWIIPGFSVPDVEDIVAMIEPYVTFNKGVTAEHLYRVLNRKFNNQFEKEVKYTLQELLTSEYIQLDGRAKSWQEAIKEASIPLLNDNSIEEGYVDAMIQNINQYGPYVFMGNQTALPHASPEDGVNRTSFSLLILENPVDILDDPNFRTKIIIVLASIDSKKHLTALNDLTKILSTDHKVEALMESSSKKEVLDIIGKEE